MISAKKCISNGGTSGSLIFYEGNIFGWGPIRRPARYRMGVVWGLGVNLGTSAFLAAPTHALLL